MEVRGGDFPLDSEKVAALVVLSGVERSDRVNTFMDKAKQAAKSQGQQSDPEEFMNDDLDNLL
jgi:hypothetical protein